MGDISIAHLGDLGEVLTEKQIIDLGDVDILLIPVGGKYTINGSQAAEVVRQIGPRLIVPMHYISAAASAPKSCTVFPPKCSKNFG